MTDHFRKQMNCLLAIMLVLLPFTSVHGFCGHLGDGMEMEMQGHAGMDHCEHGADHSCAEHHGNTAEGESCCSGHCDASLGGHLFPVTQLIFDFANAHVYSGYDPPPVPHPLVFDFLRPPPASS